MAISAGSFLYKRTPGAAFLVCLTLALSVVFWTETTSLADDQTAQSGSAQVTTGMSESNLGSDDGADDGDQKRMCIICHNPHNPHEICIPCCKVRQFLRRHPGDYRGHCHVTCVTNL